MQKERYVDSEYEKRKQRVKTRQLGIEVGSTGLYTELSGGVENPKKNLKFCRNLDSYD